MHAGDVRDQQWDYIKDSNCKFVTFPKISRDQKVDMIMKFLNLLNARGLKG